MRPSRALFATSTRLLRDFIADSLYNLERGYFSKQAPVGFLDPLINFPSLLGHRAYLAEVQRRYTDLQVAWLTPVEIFSPHYGTALAQYLAHQHDADVKFSSQPLTVFEIGGGTGTLARDILGWLRDHRPDIHSTCSYTCVEISPTLAKLQHQRVAEEAGHGERFDVRRGDAADVASWHGIPREIPCFVVAMEVLDNLPHDRVWREGAGGDWHETLVRSTPIIEPATGWKSSSHAQHAQQGSQEISTLELEELISPVRDPLIAQCLDAWNTTNASKGDTTNGISGTMLRMLRSAMGAAVGESAFLPTGAVNLFHALHAALPNHRFIAADFDHLPETVIDGWGAPLVATTRDGTTIDHGTYLVQPGIADIFFPSDFELLRMLYTQCTGRKAVHMKSQIFFEKWGAEKEERKCRDGYDPLIQDYSNTAFLLS